MAFFKVLTLLSACGWPAVEKGQHFFQNPQKKSDIATHQKIKIIENTQQHSKFIFKIIEMSNNTEQHHHSNLAKFI